MSHELMGLSDAPAESTERVVASVVVVHTEPRGSVGGIVWRPGVIVTANHALRRDEEIQVTLPGAGGFHWYSPRPDSPVTGLRAQAS